MGGQCPSMDRTQLVNFNREQTLDLEFARSFVGDSDTKDGNVATVAETTEFDVVFAGDGHEGASLGF
jgi:hypothetical protein